MFSTTGNQELENIERTQFVVLTGHLDDQPLPDLIRTLRVQRKSGRLQVEYPEAPGAFFFEDGQLVDAQLGTLRGLEAIHAALSLRGASFNFNPLVRPPERSIDRQEQKFISELVEAPKRDNLSEIRIAGGNSAAGGSLHAPAQPAPLQLAPVPAELLAPLEDRLTAVEAAILSTSRRHSRERLIFALVISFLVGLSIVMSLQTVFNPFQQAPAPATSAIAPPTQKPEAAGTTATTTAAEASHPEAALTAPFKKEQEGAASSERARGVVSQATGATKKTERTTAGTAQTPKPSPAAAKETRRAGDQTAEGGYIVNVLVEVKNGRVATARVMDSRPSASAFEAAALSKARQRRYPENFSGAERLRIRVKP
jgi:hypothetical protein